MSSEELKCAMQNAAVDGTDNLAPLLASFSAVSAVQARKTAAVKLGCDLARPRRTVSYSRSLLVI
jgi:hypothetical protein